MSHSSAVSLGRGATLLLVFVSLPLFSCLKLESTACPSGLTCPSGMICAAQQDICIEESPSCGDGIEQASVEEVCDDGNILDGDGCSKDCKSDERCGNGTVDKGEVCDLGDTIGGDGCSADCKSLEGCGNRIIDYDVGEVCDKGDTIGGDGCSADCKSLEECGNHIVDSDAGEICDKGPDVEGDGCGPDCRSGEGCGDGVHGPGEQCDDGNDKNADACLNVGETCVMARCGDGITKTLEPAEECDDRGESQNCDHDCTLPRCGDGIVNMRAGEQCDPGPRDASTQTCNSNCKVSQCGDGIVNMRAGEVCDLGPYQGCGRCSPTCTRPPLAKAKGRITAPSGSIMMDQDIFSISDGMNLPIIFEFDTGNSVSNGHIRIPIQSSDSAVKVAEAIKNAINHPVPSSGVEALDPPPFSLRIEATQPWDEPYVDLQHEDDGISGNQLIIEAVQNSGFKVTGMSGGYGKDCAVGARCLNADDCSQGLTCEEGRCR
jgi:cysteine-rich repeat protein